MRRRAVVVCGFALLGLLLAPIPKAASQAKVGREIRVRVNYTGSATVDEKHKIYLALWDSPSFMESSSGPPVDIKSLASKSGVVTFAGVAKTPAYVSAAFDPTGQWDATSGPPPDGSSLGLYSKTPGKAEPIDVEPGKPTTVTITFDDSVKMKDGKPSR